MSDIHETSQQRQPLVVITEGLTGAKAEIGELLNGVEYSHIRLFLVNSIDQMINRLHFLTGTTPQAKAADQFPPVTNFMGEKITLPKQLVEEDLSPDEFEKERFREKVRKLYETIDTSPVDGILNTYTLPEDQLVIRGVAKRAGLEDFENRPITVKFIEDITMAILEKKEKAAEDIRIAKELENQNKLGELKPKLADAVAAGDQLAKTQAEAQEALEKATTDNAKSKFQSKIDLLKVQIEANLKLQINLEDQIKQLTPDGGTNK